MTMIRAFAIECDAGGCGGINDTDTYEYAEAAVKEAKKDGFHMRNYKAICADCWDQGWRFDMIVEVA